jgi:hypothetical protein
MEDAQKGLYEIKKARNQALGGDFYHKTSGDNSIYKS